MTIVWLERQRDYYSRGEEFVEVELILRKELNAAGLE